MTAARTTPLPAPAQSDSTITPALAALADITARLASSEALSDVLPRLLETLRLALAAQECVLWLQTPRGAFVRSYGIGIENTAAGDVAAMVADERSEDNGLLVARLVSGRRLIGALSARAAGRRGDAERLMFTAVANLLGPVLSHAEHSHQLEVEVALRTRQIEEQRRFTERIIDSLPLGLYVIDREFRITAWNRKRETGMQGVSREEALGRTIFEILHRQPAALLRREFEDVFATGNIQQFQTESTTTGDLRTYRISKIPMRIDDGDVTHVITIGEDVSEWREAEARFAQAEKLAAIGQLAAGVMHEINNPLATVAACAESTLLRLEDMEAAGVEVPSEASEYLKLIDTEVHRCKRIIDGLLDFSRPKPTTKEPVNVNAVIEQTLFLLKHHARFKKVNVQTDLDSSIEAAVLGSFEQLIQVFMALLINALDAMNERGTITIRTRPGRRPGEALVAEVIDQGPGVDRSKASKIFEPFFTTKAPGRGTGLGLSICYAIITEHGGRIEVDSVPGSGATFRIVLPSMEAAA